MDILHDIISQCEKKILYNYKKGLNEYFNSYETSRRLIKCLILSSIYYDYISNDADSFYRSVTLNEWPKAIIEVFLQKILI
jgi:hypothetical protein